MCIIPSVITLLLNYMYICIITNLFILFYFILMMMFEALVFLSFYFESIIKTL
jgi:hypothetical protein